MTRFIIASTLSAAAFLAAANAASAQQFVLDGDPVITEGDPVRLKITDLPPDTDIEVQAERAFKAYYQAGMPSLPYRSSLTFRSDEEGMIDLSTGQDGAVSEWRDDLLSLVAAMEAEGDEPVSPSSEMTLTASIDGEIVATTTLDMRPKLRADAIEEVAGLPGSYFAAAPGPGKHPVIIVVDGADTNGDGRERIMPRFVGNGYSVFYFATYEVIYGPRPPSVEGLPTTYVDIPVDRLQRVHDWLAARDDVDADRIGLYGYSRNGAYVLLAATRFDWVKAVAGISPSDVVWEGWGDRVALGSTSSYSWKGEPLPYVPYSDNWFRETAKFSRGERGRLRTPMDEGRRANPDRVAAARIPTEQFAGDVLVVGGEKDDLWSAAQMSQNVAERRAEAGRSTTLLVLPEAAHGIAGTGYDPTFLFYAGDERLIEARAQAKTWATTIEFFDRTLKPAR